MCVDIGSVEGVATEQTSSGCGSPRSPEYSDTPPSCGDSEREMQWSEPAVRALCDLSERAAARRAPGDECRGSVLEELRGTQSQRLLSDVRGLQPSSMKLLVMPSPVEWWELARLVGILLYVQEEDPTVYRRLDGATAHLCSYMDTLMTTRARGMSGDARQLLALDDWGVQEQSAFRDVVVKLVELHGGVTISIRKWASSSVVAGDINATGILSVLPFEEDDAVVDVTNTARPMDGWGVPMKIEPGDGPPNERNQRMIDQLVARGPNRDMDFPLGEAKKVDGVFWTPSGRPPRSFYHEKNSYFYVRGYGQYIDVACQTQWQRLEALCGSVAGDGSMTLRPDFGASVLTVATRWDGVVFNDQEGLFNLLASCPFVGILGLGALKDARLQDEDLLDIVDGLRPRGAVVSLQAGDLGSAVVIGAHSKEELGQWWIEMASAVETRGVQPGGKAFRHSVPWLHPDEYHHLSPHFQLRVEGPGSVVPGQYRARLAVVLPPDVEDRALEAAAVLFGAAHWLMLSTTTFPAGDADYPRADLVYAMLTRPTATRGVALEDFNASTSRLVILTFYWQQNDDVVMGVEVCADDMGSDLTATDRWRLLRSYATTWTTAPTTWRQVCRRIAKLTQTLFPDLLGNCRLLMERGWRVPTSWDLFFEQPAPVWDGAVITLHRLHVSSRQLVAERLRVLETHDRTGKRFLTLLGFIADGRQLTVISPVDARPTGSRTLRMGKGRYTDEYLSCQPSGSAAQTAAAAVRALTHSAPATSATGAGFTQLTNRRGMYDPWEAGRTPHENKCWAVASKDQGLVLHGIAHYLGSLYSAWVSGGRASKEAFDEQVLETLGVRVHEGVEILQPGGLAPGYALLAQVHHATGHGTVPEMLLYVVSTFGVLSPYTARMCAESVRRCQEDRCGGYYDSEGGGLTAPLLDRPQLVEHPAAPVAARQARMWSDDRMLLPPRDFGYHQAVRAERPPLVVICATAVQVGDGWRLYVRVTQKSVSMRPGQRPGLRSGVGRLLRARDGMWVSDNMQTSMLIPAVQPTIAGAPRDDMVQELLRFIHERSDQVASLTVPSWMLSALHGAWLGDLFGTTFPMLNSRFAETFTLTGIDESASTRELAAAVGRLEVFLAKDRRHKPKCCGSSCAKLAEYKTREQEVVSVGQGLFQAVAYDGSREWAGGHILLCDKNSKKTTVFFPNCRDASRPMAWQRGGDTLGERPQDAGPENLHAYASTGDGTAQVSYRKVALKWSKRVGRTRWFHVGRVDPFEEGY
jgi:hypothetical protein